MRVARETMRNYPSFMAGLSIRPVVRPLNEETVEQARPLIRTLFLAVAVVLLIACANLAGLLLVRAIRRQREIAVRLALGASSATLLWQAILESLVLSVSGGIVGLMFAAGALRIGVSLLPETLPRIREIGLDWQVVAFALGLALLTGVICGLAPAFAAIRTNVNDASRKADAPAPRAEGTPACVPRWWLQRSRLPWCCWRPPACCCAASRRCARWISAFNLTIRWPPLTDCR